MTKGNGEVRELPKGWIRVQHKDIAEINPKLPSNNLSDDSEVSFLPMAAVEEKSGRYSLNETREYGRVKKGYTPFADGDVIFAKITPCMENGKIAILENLKNGIGLGSTEFHVSRLSKFTNKKYLFHYLNQEIFRRDAQQHMSGSAGQLRVPKSYFEEVEVPLAPLPEQNRIVEKIEELFSELDQGIENLKTAQQQLKVYRQAVLKWAFEGKLTEQWRQAQQQGTLKTGAELLAQIKAERENRYGQQVAAWEAAVKTWEATGKPGKKPGKLGKPKVLTPLTPAELAKLPPLPNGWIWVKLGDVTVEPKYGTSKKCTYNAIGRGVLRIPNISEGLVDRNDLKFAEFDDEEIQTYQLKEGDLLTIRSNGSVSLVGKCALVSQRDEGFLFAGYLIRIRPHTNSIDSKYLLNCLSGIFLRNQIEAKAKSTSGVNNINSDELRSLRIPICCQLEQDQIVQEIESRLSNCDQLEKTISENLQKAEALRQSILKRAFEGKLVPQDPNDEPADKLLERIGAEKQTRGNTGKGNQSKQRQLTLPEV